MTSLRRKRIKWMTWCQKRYNKLLTTVVEINYPGPIVADMDLFYSQKVFPVDLTNDPIVNNDVLLNRLNEKGLSKTIDPFSIKLEAYEDLIKSRIEQAKRSLDPDSPLTPLYPDKK